MGMKELRRRKIWLDLAIIIMSCSLAASVWNFRLPMQVILISFIAAAFMIIFFLMDCMKQLGGEDEQAFKEHAAAVFMIHELILLNEDEKPIRSWDLTDKTAVIIGRTYKDAEVDVDLGDCEYSALISIQHAVMNYCLDSWYIEDLGSQNGIQIQKVDDGKCYQVAASRPCKISAGDVIYIAKTKLLFT
ncbi:FHA domain-containing protein [Lacrimispora brassicae]